MMVRPLLLRTKTSKMIDRYLDFTHSLIGQRIAKELNLPMPPVLRRRQSAVLDHPFAGRSVLIGGGASAKLSAQILAALNAGGADCRIAADHPGAEAVNAAAALVGFTPRAEAAAGEASVPDLYLFDATGIDTTQQLRQLFDFFQPRVGAMPRSSRVAIVVESPAEAATPNAAAVHASLSGFMRSFAKEAGGRGTTVNLIVVAKGGEDYIAGALRFFLSDHSAFVCGQSLLVGPAPDGATLPMNYASPMRDKIAVVTGAARGIGAAIAVALAREGARVVGVDVTKEEVALGDTVSSIGGFGLVLDVTAPDAAKRLRDEVSKRFGGIDVMIHNAGITRDKTLKNMQAAQWDQVIDVNLNSILRTTEQMLANNDTMKPGARFVCTASIGGIAGFAGQTNYAATKAAVIGYVEAMAAQLAPRGMAINAVAPGFIETQMTAAMPLMPREVGRRLSSLGQGGLPQDIAEAVIFLASPAAAGINGRTLRVCGQNFMGA